MRLYLDAKSKNKVGYTPDWIQFAFIENKTVYELTLDIRGDIDYDPSCLSCRCKGEAIPWTLYNCKTDSEIDLSEFDEVEIKTMYSNKRLSEILATAFEFLVGVYSIDDIDEKIKTDIVEKGKGCIEFYIEEEDYYYTKEFEFVVDNNY